MGDRGNIEIHGVYLYTHWGGTDLPGILARALKRSRERWDDSQYLARIIFSEMIKDDIMGLTGYGISNKLHDNQHDILHVDCDNQTINGIQFQKFIEDNT